MRGSPRDSVFLRPWSALLVGLAVAGASGLAAAQDLPPDVQVPIYADAFIDDRDPGAGPQEDAPSLAIDEVLRTSVYSVSRKPQLVRESPGVVTVITRDEILTTGARDLHDVLMLVPGVHFAVDVQGVVGIGFRGNWAAEGKVLLLLDGHELNERLYSGFEWSNHLPIDHIQRIEVIRGPGSSIYGGYAEMAVINIVTRSGKDLRGAAGSASVGQFVGGAGVTARSNLSLEVGDQVGATTYTLAGLFGRGQRSDLAFVDSTGVEDSLAGGADLDPAYASGMLSWRGLTLRGLYDGFHSSNRDGFGELAETATANDFIGYYADVQYEHRQGDRITITPRLNYKRQLPWRDDDVDSEYHYDKTVERILLGLTTSWDARDNLNILVGVEGFREQATLNDEILTGLQGGFGPCESGMLGPDCATQVTYWNGAGFGQLGLSHRLANLTVGARVERHSQFGTSFVPRVGLTRVAGRFHVKLLAARAFRAPGIENINTNEAIVPERTTVFEVETGVQLGNVFASVNLYDITIADPIVYAVETVDGMDVEAYYNQDRAGTRGGELEVKVRGRRGFLNANASLYSASGKNRVALYQVPGKDHQVLGLPVAKVTLSGALRLWRNLSLGPSIIGLSRRYGFESDGAGGRRLFSRDPALVVNAFLRYPDLGMKGLEVGAGIYNALNVDYRFDQPYDGGHPSLPAPSRELYSRIAYHVGF